MNGNDGDGSLKSFYGYKETFRKETTWVSIPSDLTFVHTNNPYDDEEGQANIGDDTTLSLSEQTFDFDSARHDADFRISQASYPAYATHGLEALSAVASQDQYSYAPPPAVPMNSSDPRSGMSIVEELTAASLGQPQGSTSAGATNDNTSAQNLDFSVTSTGQTPGPMMPGEGNIDPRLHSADSPPNGLSSESAMHHVRTQSFASANIRSPHSKGHSPSATACIIRPGIRRDPELGFLLRDFSERAGSWMDIFDLSRFFSTTVPVLAVRCPLLLYSCASLSCKSLARVDGRKPVMGGQVSPGCQSLMERWPGSLPDTKGWMRKGREYYDLAVSLLRQALSGASWPLTSSLPQDTAPGVEARITSAPLPATDSEELLASTVILCVYEFLDGSSSEWSRHLDGAKTLFDIVKDRISPLTVPPDTSSSVALAPHPSHHHIAQHHQARGSLRQGPSPGQLAVFWNVARQDMLSAFINHTSTRLDTTDLPMWRNAGLRLNARNLVCPSHHDHLEFTAEDAMTDDMICNTLVWLIMKLVNFMSAQDKVFNALQSADLRARQRSLLEQWDALDEQLQAWFEGLPDSFHAVAIGTRDSLDITVDEKWFPRPMCASSMQWYHFARIQLLRNRPDLENTTPGKSSPVPDHAAYVETMQDARIHAIEILSIALGRSDEGARVHSVQPLWTAGLILGAEENRDASIEGDAWHVASWRRLILDCLRGIEHDMGWETSYRVKVLLELWNLPPRWPDAVDNG